MRQWLKFVLIIVGTTMVVTGCGASTKSTKTTVPPIAPSPTVSTIPSDVSCATAAANNTYVQAISATGSTLSAHPATLVCGGADDQHYNVQDSTVTYTVSDSAVITILAPGTSGITSKSLSVGDLPAALAADQYGKYFQIVQSAGTISQMIENYQP